MRWDASWWWTYKVLPIYGIVHWSCLYVQINLFPIPFCPPKIGEQGLVNDNSESCRCRFCHNVSILIVGYCIKVFYSMWCNICFNLGNRLRTIHQTERYLTRWLFKGCSSLSSQFSPKSLSFYFILSIKTLLVDSTCLFFWSCMTHSLRCSMLSPSQNHFSSRSANCGQMSLTKIMGIAHLDRTLNLRNFMTSNPVFVAKLCFDPFWEVVYGEDSISQLTYWHCKGLH